MLININIGFRYFICCFWVQPRWIVCRSMYDIEFIEVQTRVLLGKKANIFHKNSVDLMVMKKSGAMKDMAYSIIT